MQVFKNVKQWDGGWEKSAFNSGLTMIVMNLRKILYGD
jgi:hypothetical protein